MEVHPLPTLRTLVTPSPLTHLVHSGWTPPLPSQSQPQGADSPASQSSSARA
uniref:Uncharacterized protein n=1 Tax=uncultured marine virus TaxID=186617 RepID=A0A0F7L883_9VIRU|nr:hypothetical protein [uncultured marine virus]